MDPSTVMVSGSLVIRTAVFPLLKVIPPVSEVPSKIAAPPPGVRIFIFADPGAPAVKEIGEQIAHIAEADDGYAEDDVVVADAEVFPSLDPVLQNPAPGEDAPSFAP